MNATYPGVGIDELPSAVRMITGVPASIAAFVGTAPRSPADTPIHVASCVDYERAFGGLAVQAGSAGAPSRTPSRRAELNSPPQWRFLMSMPRLGANGHDGDAAYPGAVSTELGATSPFAPVGLAGGAVAAAPAPPPGQVLQSPFAEAAVGADDGRYAAEAVEALVAELADDEFAEALEALADEGAARHLRSVGTWSSDSEAPALATADTTQWLEQLAGETDRVLGALEAHFGDRPVDSLRDGELEAISGVTGLDGFTDPADAQELWFGSLLKKGFNLAKGLAQKGIALAGKLALGPLFGVLRKLVKPLLRKVLDSAIGRLPASVRPLAEQLAAKFRGNGEIPAGDAAGLAEAFDYSLAEVVSAPNDAVGAQLLSELEAPAGNPYTATDGDSLDAARTRLARDLAEAEPGMPPTAQLEQFIPVVMAAMPLIRTGVKIIGRDRIVNGIAEPLSHLISGMVGAEAAKLLSRHIASAGLGLLGLEAADDGRRWAARRSSRRPRTPCGR